MNACRYCFTPIADFAESEPKWQRRVDYRTPQAILVSGDLWDPAEAHSRAQSVLAYDPDNNPIAVYIKVDVRRKQLYCSDGCNDAHHLKVLQGSPITSP